MTTNRAGWLGAELNGYPCVYGLFSVGYPRPTFRPCGKPSVYRSAMGGERDCYCDEHAPEVEASDEQVMRGLPDEGEAP